MKIYFQNTHNNENDHEDLLPLLSLSSNTFLFKPLPNPFPSHHPIHLPQIFFNIRLVMASKNGLVFEDFFPSMVERLGTEGFMDELCNGFRVLMDGDKGVITFESLPRNSATVLGLRDMSDDELMCMLREGDLDGDGSLNQMEFCVLMFRLSPDLMKGSRRWLEEVGINEV